MARLSSRQQEFVASAYAAARAAGLSGVQADLAVSQAIHESAWGTKPTGTNNVHGIKGKGTSVPTHEIVGGRRVNQRASFRNFPSLVDSFRAWRGLMERKFQGVMSARSLPEAVRALRAGSPGGYATDPNYDNKVKATARLVANTPVGLASRAPGFMDAPGERPVMLADRAPIPSSLPSAFRPDNMMAAGPRFPTQVATARAPLQMPSPDRFGGRGDFRPSAPIMAGFAPDPARFGRTPIAPAPAAKGDRVGTGAFSAPPDPARFGPPPSAPLQSPQMAPGPVDPARFGQVPIAHHMPSAPTRAQAPALDPVMAGFAPVAAPSAAPATPQMRSPRSMEVGPGALSLDAFPAELAPVPMAAPVAPVPALPPAPPLPAPPTVRSLPVHEVEAGFPAPAPQPRFTAADVYSGRVNEGFDAMGNRVAADQFGNIGVTNKFGATTVTGPNGQQGFGSLGSSPIAGPLGQGGIEEPQEARHGFGGLKTIGGGLAGARMGGMVGGLPGLAIGGLLGGLFGRELSKPGGGMFANTPIGGLLGGQRTVNDGLVRNSVLGNTGGGSPSFVNEGRMPTRREYEALGVTFREGDKSGQAERARNSVGLY